MCCYGYLKLGLIEQVRKAGQLADHRSDPPCAGVKSKKPKVYQIDTGVLELKTSLHQAPVGDYVNPSGHTHWLGLIHTLTG